MYMPGIYIQMPRFPDNPWLDGIITSESKKIMKVFISYAREDSEIADRLYNDLEKAGVSPWIDRKNILPGQNFKDTIHDAIRNSSYFIALLSSKSVSKKGFVQKEFKTAIEILEKFPPNEIFIIPVRIDDCIPAYGDLAKIQWVDLFPSYIDGIRKILDALSVKNGIKIDDLKFVEIINIIEERFQKWKDLNFSSRGGTLIKYDDFLEVNKYRDKFEKEQDKEKLSFLLRCAVQNGMGGQWGKWLIMNANNEKIVLPLIAALDEMGGWKPAWRSAYLLEVTLKNEIDSICDKLDTEILEDEYTKFAIQILKEEGVKKYLHNIVNNNESKTKQVKDARIVLDEIRYFSNDIQEYIKNQNVKQMWLS